MAWLGRRPVGGWIADVVVGSKVTPATTSWPTDAAPAATPSPPRSLHRPCPPQPTVAPAAASASAVPTDPAELEQRRTAAAAAVSGLPGIDRALWQTQSTLLVYLLDAQFDPLSEICPELEHFDELAATRLQLQPPRAAIARRGFVQCRPY